MRRAALSTALICSSNSCALVQCILDSDMIEYGHTLWGTQQQVWTIVHIHLAVRPQYMTAALTLLSAQHGNENSCKRRCSS